MKMTSKEQGNVLILHLAEQRLDARCAPAFRAQLLERIDAGSLLIVIDFSKTDFVDSSGLSALISSIRRMGPKGGLAISGAKGAVRSLFALTRMDLVFPMHDTVDAAVARLAG